MLKELTIYIENNTDFVLDTDLFAGEAPAEVETQCIVVEESDPGIRNAHPELKDEGQTPYRILSRAKVGGGYFDARDNAMIVFNLLHGKTQIELPVVESGPTYLVNIECNDPYSIGPDDKDRKRLVVYLIVTRQEIPV